MFCPNCGKDCQDFKFCPDCGNNLQEIAAENQLEIKGEQCLEERRESAKNTRQPICPECFSTNILVEDIDLPIKDPVLYWSTYAHFTGYFSYRHAKRIYREKQKKGPQNECRDCGYKWHSKMIDLIKCYQPYLRKLLGENDSVVYQGENGTSLTLEWERLIIDRPKKSGIFPYAIWYWELYSARQKCHEILMVESEPRWLTICDKKHKRWLHPGSLNTASEDLYTILYEKGQIEEFRKVKDALNGIIEENKKAGML